MSDGSFLLTSNTRDSDLTTPPPMLRRHRHPADTPLADLLPMHESEKASLLANQPGLSCTVVLTADDATQFQGRQQAIKAAFRKGIGYVDPEEVRRIAAPVRTDDEEKQNRAVLGAKMAQTEALAEQPKPPTA